MQTGVPEANNPFFCLVLVLNVCIVTCVFTARVPDNLLRSPRYQTWVNLSDTRVRNTQDSVSAETHSGILLGNWETFVPEAGERKKKRY